MNFLLSFRHPLCGKYTEVEIEANTVQGAKAKVTKYFMAELGQFSFYRGKWQEDYYSPYTGETWQRTYGVISEGKPKITTAYLVRYA